MGKFFVLVLFVSIHLTVDAQSENTAWFFLSHTQKVAKKWDVLADVQVRSANKLKRYETVLLRTALNYNLSEEQAIASGYAYKGDWEAESGDIKHQPEHRIYQQYMLNHKLKRTETTVRFRLEQRFLKEAEVFDFSQRFRGFLSVQIPIVANRDFSRGWYTAIQNELFVNVQHKEKVNNHFLDQNRSYAAFGYRWSKHLDSEIGYYYWLQKEEDNTAQTNVVQLMLTTSL